MEHDINSVNIIFTLISSILTLFLGSFILIKDSKNNFKFIFFLLSVAFSGWLFGTFLLLKNKDIENVIWIEKFIYSFVFFIPSFLYHFVVKFTKNEKKYVIFVAYFFSFFFLFINLFTTFFIKGIFEYKWGVHMRAEFFHNFFLIFFFYFLVKTYGLLFIFCKENNGKVKKQATLLFVGFFILGTIGSTGFLPAYGISIFPFAHFSALFFVSIIGYAISKYELLGIKFFATYFLIGLLNLISFVHIFISKNVFEYLIEITSFLLIFMISYLLVRDFKEDIKQNAHLKQMSGHLKKAIDSLEFTNKKLKELDRAKNEFLSVAAHQLRTPATAVKGYTSMILDGNFGKCDPEVIVAIKKVYQANERMTVLVEDLLNTSRIESGHLKYDFQKLDIKNILEELEYIFSIRVRNTKISFSIEYSNEPVFEVMADRNKIREVISNIIDNAIKYTIEGSVKVFLSKEDDFVKISVEDTGRGMTERTIENLFEKFTRGEESSSEVEGTGLGLFIVKKIIEKHEGTISAFSEGLGKGSKFVVKLPVERKEYDEKSLKKEKIEVGELLKETEKIVGI